MAAKKLLDESTGHEKDCREPKRRRTTSIAAVIGEVAMMRSLQSFCSALEPMLRRVVNEEVEKGFTQGTRISRSLPLQIQAQPLSDNFELCFAKKLSVPVFTGSKLEDQYNNPLQLILVDTRGNQKVRTSLPYPIKIEIVVIDGEFSRGECGNWTSEYFDSKIVKERTGKRPLITGDVVVTMRDGCVTIGGLSFTDNSSWIRSRNFILAARVVPGSICHGIRIREALTEPFSVKDHRGESYKKHHPPLLNDEVWRLEKIGKEGVFHKKLTIEGVNTVQDFLKLWVVEPTRLRAILEMSDKMFELTIKHAKDCDLGNKNYMLRGGYYTVFLNPICEVVGVMINGYPYSTNDLTAVQRVHVENLVKNAYAHWSSLEEVDWSVHENTLLQIEPWLRKGEEDVRMPTAPWMRGPLLIPSEKVLDFSEVRKKKDSNKGNSSDERIDRSLTDKVSGRRGKQVMRKIVQSVTKLQRFRNLEEPQSVRVKDLFNLKESQKGVEEMEFKFPVEQVSNDGNAKFGAKMPWAKADRVVIRRLKKVKVKTAAEMLLPELVLKSLRSDAAKMKKWVKVKKAGVTQAVVDEIKKIWRSNELAMVKFDLPLCLNMDRALEILEVKTGGLVVWRNKDSHVIYRGCEDELKSFQETHSSGSSLGKFDDGITTSNTRSHIVTMSEYGGVDDSLRTCMDERLDLPTVSGTLFEREGDRLLDGLGPRFVDWWRPKPLPVDADMLAEVVPGFTTPFRRCPPNVRLQLADDELTYLRKLARPLPTHFALGRNTKLQGLAAAIITLWEKSLIVKIAVKWGIPNTNNEQMACELKHLTGGVLILRNKFFIIIYRGKDFLPVEVANMVVDRESELKRCQQLEEGARRNAIESFSVTNETVSTTIPSGTFSEFRDIQTKYGHLNNDMRETDIQMEAEKEKLVKEMRKQEHKLLLLKRKIERSAKALSKLNSAWKIAENDVDQELITEEERSCLQKMGLRTNKTLVLGRRGVFDGVIGSMHQHWKHREVIKVITMQKSFSKIMNTATLLEIESGGILVAVEKLQRGHAIILYRGKNYRRPLKLLPDNLLTKRAALQRSLEMQKIGSLKFFAYQRQRTISNLKIRLRSLLRKSEEIDVSPSGVGTLITLVFLSEEVVELSIVATEIRLDSKGDSAEIQFQSQTHGCVKVTVLETIVNQDFRGSPLKIEEVLKDVEYAVNVTALLDFFPALPICCCFDDH
ncbi:Chloroplastic group iia intron splicing facilitator crs1 protein [Thalictrum thalictroides]|uniref:Chloroplastic group iia intron splicing facilitator crs1 protein n=1 Tax=Thalictrum thalictroides TaxID=46969 RepID=A0A7J6VYA5_THATH|nr:Chloroplastic group iia intron splicing facilitator crs1 protein [Thalictrum thalictroides]